MRLVHAFKPFPFCVTTQDYDGGHVEGEGLHPFRLSRELLFEWFWRARYWNITLGYDHATVPISEEYDYLEGFGVSANEKARICKPWGIRGVSNPTDPGTNIRTDFRFYGPWEPLTPFPDVPTDATIDLSGTPSVIREVNPVTDAITYRPLIVFATRFGTGSADTFFSNSEDLIDACVAASAGFVKAERTGSFMGATWKIFGMASTAGDPADEDWNIEVAIDEWFPFDRMNGTDPIYNTATGAVLPGKNPGAHRNPRE